MPKKKKLEPPDDPAEKRIFRDRTTGRFTRMESWRRSHAQDGEPNIVREKVPVAAVEIDDIEDLFDYEDYDGYEHEYHGTGDTGKKK